MPANQYGIDMGQLYRTTEAVKGARTQNKMAGLDLSERERMIAERPQKEAAALERKNMLTGLRTEAAGGDANAQQQLLAVDPEGGASFLDAVGKMDDRKLEATKRSVDEIGQLSSFVLSGGTPDEQSRRYTLMYNSLPPESQANMPDQFDPDFMQMSLTRATAMDQILENPKAITVGGEDVLYKGGQQVGEAESIESKRLAQDKSEADISFNERKDREETRKQELKSKQEIEKENEQTRRNELKEKIKTEREDEKARRNEFKLKQEQERNLAQPKSLRVGGEDVVYRGGQEIERAPRPVKSTAKTGSGSGGGELKTADENLMYRQSVELLGGLFDQSGNITKLDPQLRNKVQGIAAEAAKIWKETKNISRTEAVKRSAKKFGINVADYSPSPESNNNNDPLGIR